MRRRNTANELVPLIEKVALLLRGRAKQDRDAPARLRGAFTKTGRTLPQVALDPDELATMYRVLDFGESYRAYFGSHKRVPSLKRLSRMPAILRELGVCKGIKQDPQTAEQWERFLRQAIRELHGRGAPEGFPSALELPDPDWRLVRRASVIDLAVKTVSQGSPLAVVGMSGAGKTVLLRHLREALTVSGFATHDIDASPTYPLPQEGFEPNADRHLQLALRIVRVVAQHAQGPQPTPEQEINLHEAFRQFVEEWPQATNAARDPSDSQERFFVAIRNRLAWPHFLRALIDFGHGIRDHALVSATASILAIGARDVVLCIDNAYGFHETLRMLRQLFIAQKIERAGRPRLVVTSVEKDCLTLINAPYIDLDDSSTEEDDVIRHEFALNLISATAVAATEPLTQSEAKIRISAFRETEIDRKPRARDSIDAIVRRLRAHPLALATIAAAWRDHLDDAEFWENVGPSLDTHATYLLSLAASKPYEHVTEKRHYDVLGALLLGWSLLDDNMRDRYLDLVTAPPQADIEQAVFHHLWRSRPRGGLYARDQNVLPAVFNLDHNPLRQFADRSLLQADRSTKRFRLHDLLRLMLERQLGAEGIRLRHLDLLQVFGFADSRAQFSVENDMFLIEGANRMVLVPAPFRRSARTLQRNLSNYWLSNLPRHFAALAPSDSAEHALVNLLTSFRYLQARLDTVHKSTSHTDQTGNVTAVLDSLAWSDASSAQAVRKIVRIASAALEEDRTQLAGQLLARLQPNADQRLSNLRLEASSLAPGPVVLPRLPVSVEPTSNIISFFKHPQLVGIQWVEETASGPAIISWSRDGSICVWDVKTNRKWPLSEMKHRDAIGGARWISYSGRGADILSWADDGSIRLWNATTGQLRLSLVQSDDIAPGACAFKNEAGSVRILGWAGPHIYVWDAADGNPCMPAIDTRTGRVHHAIPIHEQTSKPKILSWGLNVVSLWDAISGKPILKPMEHNRSVRGAHWIEEFGDGPAILSWSEDGSVRLWDTTTGDERLAIAVEPKRGFRVYRAIWCANADGGPGILTLSNRGVTLWDATTGAERLLLRHEDALVNGMAWIDDLLGGCAVLTWGTDQTVRLWDASVGRELVSPCLSFESMVQGAACVTNAARVPALLTWSGFVLEKSEVDVWALTDDGFGWVGSCQHDGRVRDAIWIGRTLGISSIVSWGDDWTIRVWKATEHADTRQPNETHRGPIENLVWVADTPKGSAVLSYSINIVHLWRVAEARFEHISSFDYKWRVRGVEWVPDAGGSPAILVWHQDGSIWLWDVNEDRKRTIARMRHVSPPTHVDTHLFAGRIGASWVADADGVQAILSWADDGQVRLWNAETGAPIGEPFVHQAPVGGATWLARSDLECGSIILSWSGDGFVHLWNPGTGLALIPPIRHEQVRAATWVTRPNQPPRILSWSYNGTVHLWDPKTGEGCGGPFKHQQRVRGACWVPDVLGRPRILSWSGDGTIRLWDTSRESRSDFLINHNGDRTSAAWVETAADGPVILSWSNWSEVCVWKIVETGPVLLDRLDCSPRRIASVDHTVTERGLKVVCCSTDGVFRIWSPMTNRPISRLDLNARATVIKTIPASTGHAISFVTGSQDGSIGVFDVNE